MHLQLTNFYNYFDLMNATVKTEIVILQQHCSLNGTGEVKRNDIFLKNAIAITINSVFKIAFLSIQNIYLVTFAFTIIFQINLCTCNLQFL